MSKQKQLVIGSLQEVAIPSLGLTRVVAKVDTGAWSGALHCTNVREEGGRLYFTPLGKKKLATSVDEFMARTVRSAHGHEEERYVIPITVEIDGKNYDTVIGLTNRRMMRREMLLGRRFLLENNILVDVSLTVEDGEEAKEDL